MRLLVWCHELLAAHGRRRCSLGIYSSAKEASTAGAASVRARGLALGPSRLLVLELVLELLLGRRRRRRRRRGLGADARAARLGSRHAEH